jgi:poly-gamma-glutamate capsule biosynthesis protein CapA/YwtB (metallophosphatase superfamily)
MHGKKGKGTIRVLWPLILLMVPAFSTPGSDTPAAPNAGITATEASPTPTDQHPSGNENAITLFLCGDVMIGRGIDQILLYPSDPRIYESFVKDARDYVQITEQANGPIPRPVGFSYIWGDALQELDRVQPDLRIINLETSITRSDDFWPGKGINYRMHPDNVPCLQAAEIDACSLANNHTMDWGYTGLLETMETLARVNIRFTGVGNTREEARTTPAVFEIEGKGRVIVSALCTTSSGVPSGWAAQVNAPGVNLIRDFSDDTVRGLAEQFARKKRAGDILVVSIHWGGNWGYEISKAHRSFAHKLIDQAGVDVVHGHSSHHPRPIEVYNDKLILYGCGDFINDYEGIGGYEEYRDDLALMYFPRIDPAAGQLIDLQMTPLQIKRMRLQRASRRDARWLQDTLNRYSTKLGTHLELEEDNRLYLN